MRFMRIQLANPECMLAVRSERRWTYAYQIRPRVASVTVCISHLHDVLLFLFL